MSNDRVEAREAQDAGLEIPGAEHLGSFRQELRTFFAEQLPPELASRIGAGFHARREDMQFWARRLQAQGWSAPHWPAEYGGPGWSPLQRYIFAEESARAGAPPHGIQGLTLIGPVIYTFGSPEQKARYLPKIVAGEEIWAQGFSEPGAGSDLASLTTRGEKVEGGWRITGRKIWTSEFHLADQFYCLTRTIPEGKPQRGLSILVMPTSSPGISVRPIISIDGAHSLNEVTLDDVFVPDDGLIGRAGEGWSYAKFLLAKERAWAADLPRLKRNFAKLISLLSAQRGSTRIADDEVLGRLQAQIMSLEGLTLKALEEQEAGIEAPIAGSVLKVLGSELQQRLQSLQVRVLGPEAAIYYSPYGDDSTPAQREAGAGVVGDALFRRAATIYGGANEVQRDIIARAVLAG